MSVGSFWSTEENDLKQDAAASLYGNMSTDGLEGDGIADQALQDAAGLGVGRDSYVGGITPEELKLLQHRAEMLARAGHSIEEIEEMLKTPDIDDRLIHEVAERATVASDWNPMDNTPEYLGTTQDREENNTDQEKSGLFSKMLAGVAGFGAFITATTDKLFGKFSREQEDVITQCGNVLCAAMHESGVSNPLDLGLGGELALAEKTPLSTPSVGQTRQTGRNA